MEENLQIIDLYWDRQLVRDDSGKEYTLYKGIDYCKSWKKLGKGLAKDEKSIYQHDSRVFNKFYKIIDFSTFEIIQQKELHTTYFRDKNNVYIDSSMCYFDIIPNANPKVFKVLDIDNGFSSSDNTEYWYKNILQFKLSEVYTINECYQKVGNKIYYDYLTEVNCDISTFEIVHSKAITVAKDKNYIFFKGKIVDNANPNTFHFLEDCIGSDVPYYIDRDICFYAKDNKYAYFVNVPFTMKTIRTKDLNDFRFEIVDGKFGYAFDSKYKYYNGIRKKYKK